VHYLWGDQQVRKKEKYMAPTMHIVNSLEGGWPWGTKQGNVQSVGWGSKYLQGQRQFSGKG